MFDKLIHNYKEKQELKAQEEARVHAEFIRNEINELKKLSQIAHRNISFINSTINNIKFNFQIPRSGGVRERNRLRRSWLKSIEWYEARLPEENYWAEFYLRKIKEYENSY